MGAPNQQNTRAEGPSGLFKLQKIITRKISIVSKNVTYKKMLRISFSIEKKILKRGYKIEGLDLEKFRCVFKFQKIVTRSISVLDKKVTWKKCLEYHFLLKKNLKTQKSKKGGVQNPYLCRSKTL